MTQLNDTQTQHHKEMEKKRRLGKAEDAHAASGAMSDINITPLIDVMLVLLIIFMVVTPLAQKGLDIALPQPPPPNQPEQKTPPNQVVLALEEGRDHGQQEPGHDRGPGVAPARHLPGALRQDDLRQGHGRRALRARGAGDGPRQGRRRRAHRHHLREDDRRSRRNRRTALGQARGSGGRLRSPPVSVGACSPAAPVPARVPDPFSRPAPASPRVPLQQQQAPRQVRALRLGRRSIPRLSCPSLCRVGSSG